VVGADVVVGVVVAATESETRITSKSRFTFNLMLLTSPMQQNRRVSFHAGFATACTTWVCVTGSGASREYCCAMLRHVASAALFVAPSREQRTSTTGSVVRVCARKRAKAGREFAEMPEKHVEKFFNPLGLS
jgi:hypothetical protein